MVMEEGVVVREGVGDGAFLPFHGWAGSRDAALDGIFVQLINGVVASGGMSRRWR